MNIALILLGAVLIIIGVVRACKSGSASTSVSSDMGAEVSEPKESSVSDSKSKGNDFEGYVADIIKSSGLTIKQWNQGTTSSGGAYGENELNPDFFVSHPFGKSEIFYWLECKFRSTLPAQGFELNEAQVSRYKGVQSESKRKVLIVLGLGGKAASPDELYIIPLDSLVRYKHIPAKYLSGYKLENPSAFFAPHISDWFKHEVFAQHR